MSEAEKYNFEIAVVGMSGSFPGAKNLDEFWQNLRDGVESISALSDEELLAAGCAPALLADPNFVKAEAGLADVDLFDAAFFGFTPREAEMTDPQHRLFLEHAWAALEDAGYDADRYAGRIGVYAGESLNSYLLHNLLPHRELLDAWGGMQTIIGNDRDYLATHASYKLNLKGPSLSVQTACSTSLVAIHLACQSLLNRESDMVLAGGVSVSVPQQQGAMYQAGGIISPDGHCRAFDAEAQGTVKGSGVGIVVLKRLSDALADGDTVHAVIKGSAINNDGSLKVGFTAPSIEGQASVIEEALAIAAVEPETVCYVETHGTGTALGDPIEIAALAQAFRTATQAKGFCAVGSVKTNIGHTDAAAGVAGFIKTVLALKHRQLPPSLHFNQPNPHIDFDDSPFFVNTKLAEWETNGSPRRAGVSSFGIGGTNAHVVLEEAPLSEPVAETNATPQLLTLSAKTADALEQATTNLAAHLKQHTDSELGDVAYTLQVGRREFKHRRAVVCRDAADAVMALDKLDPKRVHTRLQEQDAPKIVFMFSGQGAQYVGMARGLYESAPLFREQIDACAELLRPHLGLDLREVLYPAPARTDAAAAQLTQTWLTQPALFVVEYALAQLWTALGVRPQAMIGHSIGEFVAACLAGVFSLEDALRLVAARGRLMQQMPPGAMLAVALSERAVQPFLGEHLALAAVNAPSLCVLSGTVEAIEGAEQQLTAAGVVTRSLHVSHALHSGMMQPVVEPFVELIKSIRLRAPRIPYVSTLTGNPITAAEANDPNYWGRHLRQPVRFADGIAGLLKEENSILLEVGPGQTLGMLAQQQANGTSAPRVVLSSLRHPHDSQSDEAYLLNTLGQLWLAGAPVKWHALHAPAARRRVPLPTYPFERQRYWIEPPAQADISTPARSDLSRKPDAADWFYVPSWKRSVVPEPDAEQSAPDANACWLIFADAHEVGARIARRLEAGGADVFTINAGTEFKHIDERSFEMNPQARADYDALLKELRALKKSPAKILHLWNLTHEQASEPASNAFKESQGRGFYSLIHLAQALGEYGTDEPVNLGVVSSNLYEVTGEEILAPEKATLLGPCKVIPLEYPFINCRSIDVLLPAEDTAQAEQVARNLFAELTGASKDATVAYRGQHRWVQIFEPLRLLPSSRHAPRSGRLREAGVYLLTGGLSDIDLAVARQLVEIVRAKLVFTGNIALPARAEWEQWLAAHDEQDGASLRMKELLSLEASAAGVLIAGADIADREGVRALVAQAREQFGVINGVIHTATATGGGMIQLKTPEAMIPVLAPKVQGTLELHAALKDEAPDFFALFSTSLAQTGVFGQVDYCAANAFLDAFAHARTARDDAAFTVAIDWHIPHWEAWQQSAVAGAPEFQTQLAEMREAYGISLTEGAEALIRILSGAQPQVVVSTQDFQAVLDEQAAAFSDLPGQLSGSTGLGPVRSEAFGDYMPPGNEIEEAVARIWQEMFGIARLGVEDNFFDLGGNSLLAIQLISRLRKTFEIELQLSKLFESPTVAGLSEVIVRQRRKDNETEEIERLLREIEALSLDEVEADLAQEMKRGSGMQTDG